MKEYVIIDTAGIVYYLEAQSLASAKVKAVELQIKVWIIRQTN